MRIRKLLGAVAVALLATVASAQSPTGTVSGRAMSEGTALPGVTVTVSSPSLQGTRSTVTGASGDYLFRSLPPGDYDLKFEISGFDTVNRSLKVAGAQTVVLDVEMSLQRLEEEIIVTGAIETISQTTQAATTYEKKFVEELPINRDITGAVTLVPGVSRTGPADAIVISGAQSHENLFLVNGVVVNENLRGQPLDLFIEDAIQETTTATSGVSAEYGRFAGGVVNVLTKSGGNRFEGSLRSNLTNQDWSAKTPLTTTQTDKVNQVYEGTLGGFLWRDKAWFFLAARDFDTSTTTQTSSITLRPQVSTPSVPYANDDTQRRLEGKLTLSPFEGHRIVGSYIEIAQDDGGASFGTVLDASSVYNRELPQDLLALNYSGVITDSFLVEAQYSQRHFTFVDSGAPTTDRILGTLLVDQSTGARFHSPTFCGVCEPDEERNNDNILVKASWFASSEKLGSHDIVGGYDTFNDERLADNHQSGSDFRILTSGVVLHNSGVAPVFRRGRAAGDTFIQYNPIAVTAKPTEFRTNSYFANDVWRLNNHFTFNIGVRYDQNDGVDSAGATVADDSKLSPRLGVTYDLKGDGDWIFNAAYAEYVAAIASTQANAASTGGVPATLTWFYEGPDVNRSGATVDSATALQILFNWFDSIGGINSTPNRSISIPGGNVIFRESLKSPSTTEYTLGLSKKIGSRGLVRADYVHRDAADFYVDRRDLTTGAVTLPNGSRADLSVVENNDSLLERTYDGVHLSARYRVTDRLDLGGNWTVSKTEGNVEGETRASGPVRSAILNYPEYFDNAWSNPKGYLQTDQRHRARLFANYRVFDTEHHRLNVSLLQAYLSGQAYSAAGAVDTRLNATTNPTGVVNPGYVRPPTSVTYFFSDRGAFRTPDIFQTDLAFNYSFVWGAFGRDLEVFVQPEILNVFNSQRVATTDSNFFDTTIIDATNTTRTSAAKPNPDCPLNTDPLAGGVCQRFNPFTTTPVEGLHWAKGPRFGQATNPNAYQTPRTFRVSLGFRF